MSAQAVPSGPGSAAGPRRRGRRLWWLPRSWRDSRSLLASWWYSLGGDDLRLAYQDDRRAPGWVLAGAVAVFWTVTGFSWLPLGAAVGLWMGIWVACLWLPWWVRRRVRRRLRRLIPLVAFIWLAVQAGIYAWSMALGLWLLGAGLLDKWRARRRLLAWLRIGIAEAGRLDPEEIGWSHAE